MTVLKSNFIKNTIIPVYCGKITVCYGEIIEITVGEEI